MEETSSTKQRLPSFLSVPYQIASVTLQPDGFHVRSLQKGLIWMKDKLSFQPSGCNHIQWATSPGHFHARLSGHLALARMSFPPCPFKLKIHTWFGLMRTNRNSALADRVGVCTRTSKCIESWFSYVTSQDGRREEKEVCTTVKGKLSAAAPLSYLCFKSIFNTSLNAHWVLSLCMTHAGIS